MNFRHIKVEQTSPAVATVIFNRPAKANAFAKTTPTFTGN